MRTTAAQLEQIDAVTPPAGDEAEIDAMLAAAQKGVDALKADPSALMKGALDEGTQLAAVYGLEVCGSEE